MTAREDGISDPTAAGPASASAKARKKVRTTTVNFSSRILTGPLGSGLLRFGMPLVVAMALTASFNLVDMFIVGQLPNGTASLSALGLCDLIAMLAAIMGTGVSNASVALIARRQGERDYAAVSHMSGQSVSLTLIMSLCFAVLGIFFSGAVVEGVMGAKGEVAVLATEYMEIIIGGSVTILMLLQLVALLRAVGDSRTPMYLLVGSAVGNFFVSVVMVYGTGPTPEIFSWQVPISEFFGVEPMGVAGAAWSTVLTRAVAVAFGLYILWKRQHGLRFTLRDLEPKKRGMGDLVRIAWPLSAQLVLRVCIVIFFASIVTHTFTTETESSILAGFSICTRLDSLVLFIAMGWGAAASTYVGQNLGAQRKDRAALSGWLATGYNTLFMVGVLGVYMLYPDAIIGLFDDSPEVIAAGSHYLSVVGLSYAFLGAGVVLANALSGAGATLSSLVLDASLWLGLVVPITVVAVVATDISPTATWVLIAAGNVISAVGYLIWFKMGHWTAKQV